MIEKEEGADNYYDLSLFIGIDGSLHSVRNIRFGRYVSTMRGSPAPPPPDSPAVYMTPFLSKRRDALFPSLLDTSDPSRSTKPAGGLNKPYRTNAKLLLQLRTKSTNSSEVNSDGAELQALREAMDETIVEIMEDCDDVVDVKFQASGCCWTMFFNDDMNDAHENYCIEIVLLANEISGTLNYVADVILQPLVDVDPDPTAPPLKGFREAKGAFESIALAIRKCIVRLEFPEFPEGCKGRSFREVYQLNARVSRIERGSVLHPIVCGIHTASHFFVRSLNK